MLRNLKPFLIIMFTHTNVNATAKAVITQTKTQKKLNLIYFNLILIFLHALTAIMTEKNIFKVLKKKYRANTICTKRLTNSARSIFGPDRAVSAYIFWNRAVPEKNFIGPTWPGSKISITI